MWTKNYAPTRNKRATILYSFVSSISTCSTSLPYSLFKRCKSPAEAKHLHQQVLVRGLLPQRSYDNISTYLANTAHSLALTQLQRMPPCRDDIEFWNGMIRQSVSLFHHEDALDIYVKMKRSGWSPDSYTYPFVLKAAGEIPSFSFGITLHASILVSGFSSNVFVCNSLVTMYGRCGAVGWSGKVFNEMSERGVSDRISWNAIVASYVQNRHFRAGIELFKKMNHCSGVSPDAVSLVNVLPACAALGLLLGKQVHCLAIRRGLNEELFVCNALMDQYAKLGMMLEANRVFERMETKDVVSWNAMVTGYCQLGQFEEALRLLEEMKKEKMESNVVTWSAVIAGYAQREHGYEALNVFRRMCASGLEPNSVTIISLLSACAGVGALVQGKEIHCYSIKQILNLDGGDSEGESMVVTGLIDMYCKCKEFGKGLTILSLVRLEDKNVAMWTAMIGGYAQQDEASKALQLFSQMIEGLTPPNSFTISCVLMACARLGVLRTGKEVHAFVLRNHFGNEVVFVDNCLIDMYSKSGDIGHARIVFDKMDERNVVSWTSLMAGYGMHGFGEEALEIFDKMRQQGFSPDAVTFVVVLYACSHSGLTGRGIEYFYGMEKKFGVVPGAEHYASMVDLLGRAGRLDEAMKLIEDMPMDPNAIVWVALLSSCRLHANIDLAEYAVSRLSRLGSENDGTYTLLSNIYAGARRWKDVARIRSLMKHSGVNKRPGCSWVQGKNGTQTFYVGDWSHPLSQKMLEVLSDLMQRIKEMGYEPQTSFALHDVDEEEKGDLLFEHSEKLALAYAIVTSRTGSTIRITKNLRVCGDCHSAFTYISKIVDHEIILRDSSRFHHFSNGSCSCKGYW